MKQAYWVLTVLSAVWVSACTSPQPKTEPIEKAPAVVQTAPAKESPRKKNIRKVTPAVQEVTAVQEETVESASIESKFSRVKLGMTLSQVEQAIGQPDKQVTHSTSKASIPFYFGADRWVIEYEYKGEGVLTFNSGGDQLLTSIKVGKGE
jgi:hypothetical protein